MYKAPKTTTDGGKRSRRYDLRGSEYGYIDSETPSSAQNFSGGSDDIFSPVNNPLAKSLEKLFARQKIRANKVTQQLFVHLPKIIIIDSYLVYIYIMFQIVI